jgi:hypothetical protein
MSSIISSRMDNREIHIGLNENKYETTGYWSSMLSERLMSCKESLYLTTHMSLNGKKLFTARLETQEFTILS